MDAPGLLISEYQRNLSKLASSKGGDRSARFWRIFERYIPSVPAILPQVQASVTACFAAKEIDLEALDDLALWGMVSVKTITQFRAKLWTAVKRLWNGGSDSAFVANFARNIDDQLTQAWDEGADSVGVAPDEMTPDDLQILNAIIDNENQFILRLAGDIQADREGGMKEEAFESKYGARVNLWANRYNEVVNRARIVFGEKQRFEWVEGPTEDKCGFCSALNGIVAFGYEWEEARCHPQMPPNAALTGEHNGKKGCEGWGCQCQFKPTKKRRTPRAFDRITHIVVGAKL